MQESKSPMIDKLETEQTQPDGQAGADSKRNGKIVISADGLTKKFGDTVAVDDVDLRIPAGKIFGFIGPSGCGKTTTVRLLLGVYRPTSGRALVLGENPQDFSRAEQEQIGYMPQLFVLYPSLTVWENLNFAASLYGVPLRRKERLRELLELVELDGHENKKTSQLSGGMQRRLSLATALVHDPQVLFLDEPTAGIDPVLRQKFWDYFKQLQAQGRTLFITTQYVGEATYCDYVGLMTEGRLVAVEAPEALRRRASGGDIVELRLGNPLTAALADELQALSYVRGPIQYVDPFSSRLIVDDASMAVPDLIEWFREREHAVVSIREYHLPFDDVFVRLIEDAEEAKEKEEQTSAV